MDVEGFSNPWEHVRLLSDRGRNEVLIELLRRHAPGRRVLEVGCGSGLLSCVAAKMGATAVFAVEPTAMADTARALVQANGMQRVVTVLDGMVQDLVPRPVDLAFSELLNAQPYAEGVLEAMDGAAAWLAPGGMLAPRRMRVWAALARDTGSSRESRLARAEVARIADACGLSVGPIEAAMAHAEVYPYLVDRVVVAGPPVVVHDLALGGGERPPDRCVISCPAEPGPVDGVVLWFEALLDDQLVLANAPGTPGHWGHLVCSWPQELAVKKGGVLQVQISVGDDGLDAVPC